MSTPFTGLDNLQRLHSLHDLHQTLSPASNDADIQAFGEYFAPSARAYLKTMRSRPTIGRDDVVKEIRQILLGQRLVKRDVLTETTTNEGRKVIVELKSTMDILSKPYEQEETVIATFDDRGLIEEYKVYACGSHIAMITQEVTGKGPYSAEYMSGHDDLAE